MDAGGRASRKVWFVVVRDGVHPDVLTEEIGAPPDRTSFHTGMQTSPETRAVEGCWEVGREGTGDDALSVLVDSVLSRVRLAGDRLMAVCAREDTTCLLRIVQYVSEDDSLGHGFVLESQDVALLAELGAFVDVDQYVA